MAWKKTILNRRLLIVSTVCLMLSVLLGLVLDSKLRHVSEAQRGVRLVALCLVGPKRDTLSLQTRQVCSHISACLNSANINSRLVCGAACCAFVDESCLGRAQALVAQDAQKYHYLNDISWSEDVSRINPLAR